MATTVLLDPQYGRSHLVKVLTRDGYSPYHRTRWALPRAGAPGAWMPALPGNPRVCQHGYHGTTISHLAEWVFPHSRVFLCEAQDPTPERAGGSQWVTTAPVRLVRELALDDAAARWLAVDLQAVSSSYIPHRPVDLAALFDWASAPHERAPRWTIYASVEDYVHARLGLPIPPRTRRALFRRWWGVC